MSVFNIIDLTCQITVTFPWPPFWTTTILKVQTEVHRDQELDITSSIQTESSPLVERFNELTITWKQTLLTELLWTCFFHDLFLAVSFQTTLHSALALLKVVRFFLFITILLFLRSLNVHSKTSLFFFSLSTYTLRIIISSVCKLTVHKYSKL